MSILVTKIELHPRQLRKHAEAPIDGHQDPIVDLILQQFAPSDLFLCLWFQGRRHVFYLYDRLASSDAFRSLAQTGAGPFKVYVFYLLGFILFFV